VVDNKNTPWTSLFQGTKLPACNAGLSCSAVVDLIPPWFDKAAAESELHFVS